MGEMKPLPAILGPTAVGKTAVSLPVAERLPAEIVNCDSRQVYRSMEVGTAKPTREERARVAHHCLDLAEPSHVFTAADYGEAARRAALSCFERGLWPLVVGGSGLYLRALEEGLFPGPPADAGLRARLKSEAEARGREHLHERLKEVDPEAARSIHPQDLIRLIRALEVYELTGEPISALQREGRREPEMFRLVGVVLWSPASALAERIERRVEAMIEGGLVEEVASLLASGCSPEMPAMQGIGYREMARHLSGGCSLEEAAAEVAKETRRYAKRQMTWFRKLAGVEWIEATGDAETDAEAVLASLAERLPPLASLGRSRPIRPRVTAGGGGR